MRKLHAANRRPFFKEPRVGLVAIVVVHALFVLTDGVYVCGNAFSARPFEHALHYWMLLVLGAAYVVWSVLLVRDCVDPAGEAGFLLASFGLAATWFCHFLLFGLCYCYGSTSVIEELADGRLRFLFAAHRWGGLAAYVVGLLLVVWGGWRVTAGARGARRPSPRPSAPAA